MKVKKNLLDKMPVVIFLAILCNALWGSAFPSIKVGYELFAIPGDSPASQILFAGIRFFLAGLLAIFLGSLLEHRLLTPKKTSWPLILKLSLFQTILQYVFFYQGLAHTSGVKGAILTASNTFAAILIASLVFHQEKLTGRKIAACALGFAGVVLVNLTDGGLAGGIRLEGEGFLMISVVAYGVASCLIKEYSRHENPVTLSGYQFVLGGLAMAVAGYLLGGRITQVTPVGILVLIHLAIISSVAFSIWGILLKRYPVSKISIFGFTNPIFGVILSALILNEKSQASGTKILLALVMVCAGIILVNRPEKHKK